MSSHVRGARVLRRARGLFPAPARLFGRLIRCGSPADLPRPGSALRARGPWERAGGHARAPGHGHPSAPTA